MAFGFIKKVFSFGRKEVVEEKVDETAPLPPLNLDALEALKPAAEQEVPDFLKREEQAEAIPAPEPAAPEPEKIKPAAPEAKAPDEEPIETAAEQKAPDFLKREEQAEAIPAPEPVAPALEKIEPAAPAAKAPVEESIEAAAEPEASTAQVEQPTIVEVAPEPEEEEAPAEPAAELEREAEPEVPEPATEEPEEVSAAQTEAVQAEVAAESEPAAPVGEPEPVAEIEAKPEPEADTAVEPISVAPESELEVERAEPEKQPETQQAEEEPATAVEPESVVEEVPQAETEAAVETAEVEPASEAVAPEAAETPKVEAPEPPISVAEQAAARSTAGKVTVSKKVEQKAEPTKAPEPVAKRSWFQRMREGLARSSRELSGNIAGVFTKRKLDEETLQDLEDVLIRADLGVETALRVTDSLASSRYGKDVSDTEVRAVMAAEVEKVLGPVAKPLELDLSHKPHVILVVGVNGTGKTTTIGKLAAKLTDGGLSVMLAAGDTFRAAAIEQLKIWGERTKSPVIATKLGADAAGLAYDAFEKAKEAGSDVLIIDTAGRLQNKAELMAELEKIVRVLGKLDPEAPHTVLQTVDATTGQNALNQVEIFRNIAGVNGLVMTKLDGTARGGILVAIAAKHKLPVYFIGVGEQVDDLEPFSASDFARAIAGVG
ncbi:signal recognition particle-docking protein FtsY [Mesorhizobium sp. 1M-11]|uniref:signal recognition particle-docking protein FtsY n=1 Tax=Mesorhizobium sp. 1M-11 TaxID=1529006 RepID=UPI000A564D06|nr:signal recognition particle-docking protein FtsY [Mesorhizobium sp. 1M-11]